MNPFIVQIAAAAAQMAIARFFGDQSPPSQPTLPPPMYFPQMPQMPNIPQIPQMPNMTPVQFCTNCGHPVVRATPRKRKPAKAKPKAVGK